MEEARHMDFPSVFYLNVNTLSSAHLFLQGHIFFINFFRFMWFVVIRLALCIRNCFKTNIARNNINTDLYRLLYDWKSKKWGLSTYISWTFEISIIGKLVGFRLVFLVEIVSLSKNTREITYYLFLLWSWIHIRESAYTVTDNFFILFFTDQFQSIIPVSISF